MTNDEKKKESDPSGKEASDSKDTPKIKEAI
jgi:hypothetical protein